MILRFILLFVMIAFGISNSFCQLTGFGIKTGLNSSFQQRLFKPTNELEKENNRLGLKVGIFSEIVLNNKFSLMPALMYNQKGYIADRLLFKYPPGEFYRLESGYSIRLDYLSGDLPIKFRFSNKAFIPYLLLGPRVDRLFGYKQKLKQDPRWEGVEEENYESTYNLYHKWNIGLVAAIGIEGRVSNKVYTFLEIEYNPDLGKAINNERATIRNTLIAFNTGIKFNKK
jgi:hypothetical protein